MIAVPALGIFAMLLTRNMAMRKVGKLYVNPFTGEGALEPEPRESSPLIGHNGGPPWHEPEASASNDDRPPASVMTGVPVWVPELQA
jgi:hypothetical protein